MRKAPKIGLAAVGLLLISFAIVLAANLGAIIDFLPMASAAYSKFLCSCLFVEGKPEEQSLIWSRQIVPAGEIDIDYSAKTVTVKALGQTSRARYVSERYGCLLE